MLTAPLYTEIPIRGLRESVTVLHITDLHACELSDEDIAATPEARLTYLRERHEGFWGSSQGSAEAVLTEAVNYAEISGACAVLATGDIIDFPSVGNLNLLDSLINSRTPVFYIHGNHDWTFADTYMSQHDKDTYLPKFLSLSGMRNGVAVHRAGSIDFISADTCADRVSDDTYEAYIRAVASARSEGRAVVLNMHVPLEVDTLIPECIRVWGRNICIGEGALGSRHESTMKFFHTVTEEGEFAPDAVITGHLHLSHEDIFPNGVPQIITSNASGNGLFRIIRFVP